ncbi:hypothetical protein Ancab_032181 [Ancistrocladus abbreviatus]
MYLMPFFEVFKKSPHFNKNISIIQNLMSKAFVLMSPMPLLAEASKAADGHNCGEQLRLASDFCFNGKSDGGNHNSLYVVAASLCTEVSWSPDVVMLEVNNREKMMEKMVGGGKGRFLAVMDKNFRRRSLRCMGGNGGNGEKSEKVGEGVVMVLVTGGGHGVDILDWVWRIMKAKGKKVSRFGDLCLKWHYCQIVK